mmetsp:Transcript_9747/g.27381  ORF Transcript_9747/g.27381 Transcript_9747/m.27381 type:complete len:206 (-) Transcript_9747:177-794(-)
MKRGRSWSMAVGSIIVLVVIMGLCGGVDGKGKINDRLSSSKFGKVIEDINKNNYGMREEMTKHLNYNLGSRAGHSGNCEFECPSGKAIQKKDHVPEANGCGASFLRVKGTYDFTECCNEHDICFDTCGSGRSSCDEKFLACMTQMCIDHDSPEDTAACKKQASAYHFGSNLMGCSLYHSAQSNACECVSEEGASSESFSDNHDEL